MARRLSKKKTPARRRAARRARPAAKAAEPRPEPVSESTLVGRVKDLADLGLRLDRVGTPDELLALLRKEARWLVDHEMAFAGLLSADGSATVFHDISGGTPFEKLHGKRHPAAEGMAGWVVKHAAPIFVRIDACPAFSRAIEGELARAGVSSLLVIPLRTGGEALGALLFCSSHPAAYHDPDMWVAQILAHHVARSLRGLRQREETARRSAGIQGFARIAEAVRNARGEQQIFEAAVRGIAEHFGFPAAALYLLSSDRGEALRTAAAAPPSLRLAERFTVRGSPFQSVLTRGTSSAMTDAGPAGLLAVQGGAGLRSALAVPLQIDDETSGLLVAGDPRPGACDPGDEPLLQAVAGQVASALHTARLLERAEGTNAELLELDRLKSDFISIVSHDFRSPLASIILAAKGLQRVDEGTWRESIAEHLEIIVDQATRLSQLAEDTLSITRIESGQLSYYFSIVDLERVIADAVAAVPMGPRHVLEVRVDPGAARVKADASKVRQVVQNLVSNAVRYSPGGGNVTVRVTEAGADEVEVAVSDEGIGIPPDQVERLFRKFSRVDTPASRGVKGAGLGLWICREIVNAHGGRIWVEPNQPRGSMFRVRLQKP